jgi:hypothetical protein
LEVNLVPKTESSIAENNNNNIIRGSINTSEVGTVYTEGRGLLTSKEGETATWTGQGIRQRSLDGNTRFRGSLFFPTQSTGALSVLNNVVGIFHYEIDKDG